ncbi:MAG: tripartite tricarboxylate transporter TctB family protein [Beijerinckiaceae bacterium]
MSSHDDVDEPQLVSYRTMDIAVALLFLVASAIVITDSLRLGIAWRPNEGPRPGYFPFYIAVVMALASVVNLVRALPNTPRGAETFTSVPGIQRMAAIFVPALLYVLATSWLGIYVSSAIYIATFMIFVGQFAWWKAAAVAVGVSLTSFFMFEVWFLVPLPKGPLEAALGY